MNNATPLAQRRAAPAAAEPRLYPRDLAARLGVTEAEIVALDEGGLATRLRPDWTALLARIGGLGEVMALTRNADAVHEKIGTYGPLEGNDVVGLFVGEAIDLRLFLRAWSFAWALAPATEGARRSLQVYGPDSAAVHKVFTTASTNLAACDALLADFAATPPPPAVTPAAAPATPRPDSEIDVAGLLAGPARARPVAATSLRQALEGAAATHLPIMVFVGNPGCIQIHGGPVTTLRAVGPWFNVLDPGFYLHLRESAIDTAWVVTEPTDDGAVTSLELFDTTGQAIATLFGKRKPGQPEIPGWRELCAAFSGA